MLLLTSYCLRSSSIVCNQRRSGCCATVPGNDLRPSSLHCDALAVQQRFFDELAAILDRDAIDQEPVYEVGDFNIWLDRPGSDPRRPRLLADCRGPLSTLVGYLLYVGVFGGYLSMRILRSSSHARSTDCVELFCCPPTTTTSSNSSVRYLQLRSKRW